MTPREFVQTVSAGCGGKPPTPEQVSVWEKRAGTFGPEELGLICDWIHRNRSRHGMPAVGAIFDAARELGIYQQRGSAKVGTFQRDENSNCDRCGGWGLLNVGVEVYWTDGDDGLRRRERIFAVRPFNVNIDLRPEPAREGEGEMPRYQRLWRCDCETGFAKAISWKDPNTGTRYEVKILARTAKEAK